MIPARLARIAAFAPTRENPPVVGKSDGRTAVTEPLAPFADVLREPRAEARLRREKLAEAPGLSRGRPAI